ncbi:MAG: gluconate 2-dehydrogenase subunit 3 family protein [Firmicutes bacterium]|nr:gluconate 2-dehydrogenase subunit 3 family protein [Bacillota bacterium]
MKNAGFYPDYDVLALQDEWDVHTRMIVNKRLGPFQFKLLSEWEQQMIKAVAGHLVYEERDEILTWIAAHLDSELGKPQGEAQRKPNVPPQKTLILEGLQALELWAKGKFLKAFLNLNIRQQYELINALQHGELEPNADWDQTKQKELFQKLLGLMVEAYYSHPWVWSEIGYGGPAYPRGYVRVELGLTDPWEPRRSDTT